MYKRVVLKLSGEALAAGRGFGVDPVRIHEIAAEIAEVRAMGVDVAIVVGGGSERPLRQTLWGVERWAQGREEAGRNRL